MQVIPDTGRFAPIARPLAPRTLPAPTGTDLGSSSPTGGGVTAPDFFDDRGVEIRPRGDDDVRDRDDDRIDRKRRKALAKALRHGVRDLAKDVRKGTRRLLRGLDEDKGQRSEVKDLYKSFRKSVRDVVRTARRAGAYEPEALTASLRSAFDGFVSGLRDVLGTADRGTVALDPEAPSIVDATPGGAPDPEATSLAAGGTRDARDAALERGLARLTGAFEKGLATLRDDLEAADARGRGGSSRGRAVDRRA